MAQSCGCPRPWMGSEQPELGGSQHKAGVGLGAVRCLPTHSMVFGKKKKMRPNCLTEGGLRFRNSLKMGLIPTQSWP